MRKLITSGFVFLLTFPCFAGCAESSFLPKARKLHEFKKNNLGLMDVSSDGKLLLMHQKLPPLDRAKGIANHRLRVIEASTLKEKGAIEFQSSNAYILFRPGTHQVLLNGELRKPAEDGCFIWNVDSGTVGKNQKLNQANLKYVQFHGPDQLLGTAFRGSSAPDHLVYDFQRDSLTLLQLTREETHFLTGFTVSPDFRTLIGQSRSNPAILTFREWETTSPAREVTIPAGLPWSCIYSPDGKYLVVVSNVGSGTESRPVRLRESHVDLYDAKTLKLKSSRRILIQELAENWILHVGSQMAVSPDGRWLVVGYDRYTEKVLGLMSYLQASYVVLQFPSLTPVAYAEHPTTRVSYEWADISSAQSGRLRFDTDSSGFYTTAKYTIRWALPQQ